MENKIQSDLLITTNGFKGTWPGIEYGAWMASTLGTRVTLLGVTEKLSPAQIDDHHPLEDVFERAVGLFQARGVEYSLEVRVGDAEYVIPEKAREGNFITALTPLGRPMIRHWLTGRSIRHLMAEISGPIVYVPRARIPLKRILICIGGLGYEVTAEHLAVQMAVKCNAEIALLHVVPPVDLDYPTAREVSKNWRHLIDTNTPPGRSLRQAVQTIEAAGLQYTLRGRQGNVVEEIQAEIKEGEYDLLCMGSPYSGSALRQLYAPNVTAEVAESAACPTLTARFKKE